MVAAGAIVPEIAEVAQASRSSDFCINMLINSFFLLANV